MAGARLRGTALIVQDDPRQLERLARVARQAGFEPATYATAASALAALDPATPPALILAGLSLPDLDGWRFCQVVRAWCGGVPGLLLSDVATSVDGEAPAAGQGRVVLLPLATADAELASQMQALTTEASSAVGPQALVLGGEGATAGLRAAFEESGYRPQRVSTPGEAEAALAQAAEQVAALQRRLDESEMTCARIATEARQSEAALRASEARYRELVENANSIILRLDRQGRITFFNAFAQRFFGYEASAVLGRSVVGTIVPETDSAGRDLRAMIADFAVRPERYAANENENTRRDGSRVWISWTNKPLYDEAGQVAEILCIGNDITARKEAEQALQDSEQRFQDMLALVPDMISIHDPDLNILYSNWQGFAAVEPAQRVRGTKCYETYRGFAGICPGCLARTTLLTGEPVQQEARLPDGTWVDLRVIPLLGEDGQVEVFMEWVRDITERKRDDEVRDRLQAQLAQAQKMESIGRLAGGVAHDFNNMLGVILGHAELALNALDPASPVQTDLQEVRRAAQRSAGLTRQLLAFAREQPVAPRVLDLNETVEGMLKMLRRLIGEDIDLAWLPGQGVGWVEMDPSQIDQVLANLCVNARDAIAATGRVTIETDWVTLETAFCASHPGAEPGDYVRLAISDDGCGMTDETRAHLFEPFYTTKELGKGTGLGLATVYGIVKQNNGYINVYSELGRGTTFRIYLPRLAMGPESLRDTPVTTPARGSETILVVEDEPAILRMALTMLTRLGYQVLSAGSPSEALRLAAQHASPIHLLLTDVVMPGMNGRELASLLLAQRPGLQCLFMSGYTASVIAQRGVLDEGVHFLQKPFAFRELSAAVRAVLDHGAGA